jgi:hypothetical protein
VLLIGALAGAVWFFLFVAAHVVTFATLPVRNRSGTILLLFGAAFVGALLSAALVPSDVVPGVIPTSHRLLAPLAAGLVMACGFVLYMPFYYTIVTSLSVQTVITIDEAPGHRLPLDALASPKVYDRIVRGRLDSMVRAGNLVRDGERFRATPKGARTAGTFARLKSLWKLGPGG